MNYLESITKPAIYDTLLAKGQEIGFNMASDLYIGGLLKALVASKSKTNLLELGTGIGLSLVWMIEGMDQAARLTSIDNDPALIQMAQEHFGADSRLQLICADGSQWIKNYSGAKFDLIFADAWPGKYSELDETLDLLKIGGLYIIDDMLPQENWPAGHQEKAQNLVAYLERRTDLHLSKMNWSTGVIIATKFKN